MSVDVFQLINFVHRNFGLSLEVIKIIKLFYVFQVILHKINILVKILTCVIYATLNEQKNPASGKIT